jgi:hypothetical protein
MHDIIGNCFYGCIGTSALMLLLIPEYTVRSVVNVCRGTCKYLKG